MNPAFEESNRRLAYVNSICLAFLIVGLIGIKSRSSTQQHDLRPNDLVPVTYILPEESNLQREPENKPQVSAEYAIESPQVMPVVPGAVEVASPEPLQPLVTVTSAVSPTSTTSKATVPVLFEPSGYDGVVRPRLRYPPEAARLHIEGKSLLEVLVSPDGFPKSVSLKESTGSTILDVAAVDWVKKWRWPAGQSRHYYVPIEFRLR